MKKRQDTEAPGAATNTDVLLKVHQDLVNILLNVLLMQHEDATPCVSQPDCFHLKPVSASTCHPRAVTAHAQSGVSSITTHHSTALTPWSMANSS